MAQITLNSTGVASNGALVLQSNGTTAAVTIDTSQRAAFVAGTAALPAITTTGDTNTGIFFPAADTIAFSEGGAEAMRLDSAGNMGLGVTPSAWVAGSKALQISSVTAVSQSANGYVNITNNAYESASETYKYLVSSYQAALYQQKSGKHEWYTAASGTAGNTISFTQAMTLDASGNLGVGVTSPVSPLTAARGNVTGAGQWASSAIAVYNPTNTGSYSQISFGYTVGTTNAAAYIGYVSTNQGANGYGDLVFGTRAVNTDTQPTERARITSAGDLLVGGTSKLSGGVFGLDINSANASGITFGRSGTPKAYFYVNTDPSSFRWQTVSGTTADVISNTNGVTLANGGTSWGSLSDERKKDIIEPIVDAATKVSSLRAVIGKYKTEEDGIRRAMLIAQDVQAVLPEAVVENKDGDLILQYTDTIPLLVAAIKEQQALITTLTDRITALESK